MYFLPACATNSAACKAKLLSQKTPANLELTGVILKKKKYLKHKQKTQKKTFKKKDNSALQYSA